jgi:hypothetical protein
MNLMSRFEKELFPVIPRHTPSSGCRPGPFPDHDSGAVKGEPACGVVVRETGKPGGCRYR